MAKENNPVSYHFQRVKTSRSSMNWSICKHTCLFCDRW